MSHLEPSFETGGQPCECDARVAIAVALALVVAIVASHAMVFSGLVLLTCLALMRWRRMGWGAIAARMAGPLAMAAILGLLRSFWVGETPIVSIGWGEWQLTITREGLWDGAAMALRVVAALSVMLALGSLVPPHRIFAAAAWARVPKSVLELAVLMHRYIFTLFDEMQKIFAVQRVRLGYATLVRSMQSMGTLAGAVILRSLDQAERTHEAMQARGYCGHWPVGRLPALARRDRIALLTGLLLVAVVYLLAERWCP